MIGIKTLAALLISLGFVFASPSLASDSGNPTTTTLTVSSISVKAKTAVRLTATVTGRFFPVTTGQVTFCDAMAAHCDGAGVFGMAQVTSSGVAAIKVTLGVGSYRIKAVFSGIVGAEGSASAPLAVTVAGAANYGSQTTLAASGAVGNYTLQSTVTAYGKPRATGDVSFLDTSYGNGLVASASLNPATLATVFNPAWESPLAENSAHFVVSADFNHDGIPDLAVVSRTVSGTVSVFIGIGNGTFQSPLDYSVGVNPQAIAVADVNGDGEPDLIVTNECADEECAHGSVSVLLGIGDGTFQTQTVFATGAFPSFVAVGDFNRDGWPDLAVANSQDGTVGILLGTGDARLFRAQTSYPVGSNPQGVAVGDFNQDTLLDLAVSNASEGTVSLLLGNGDGTFQPQQTVSLPDFVSPYWLASADLRNIGTLDLVIPDAGTSNNVYVLLGNGDGSFQPAVGYAVDAGADGVSVGDLNGDGILDLVVPNTAEDGQVSVLLGDGSGTFAAKTDVPVGKNPTFVALADFNGDGLLDIATSNSGSNTATILLQARTETATATAVAVFPAGTHNVMAKYPGDADRSSSRSTTVALIGNSPASTPTSTALAASPNPANVLQTVSLTANVTPAPNGSVLGTVSFYNGATLLGSGTLDSSGVAMLSTKSLPVGVDSLTAVYSGNASFATSTSSAIAETITALTSTATALAASPNPANVLQTVSLTATVIPPPNGSVLGTVTFYNGATLLGSGKLNSFGVATFTTKSLPVGVDSLTAVYSGNASFATSTSSAIAETIAALTSTATVLTVSPDPANVLQTVLLTATVTPAPNGSVLGTVSFYNGATLLGSGKLNSSGEITFSTTNLPAGVDSLTAVYSGNAHFVTSTSPVVPETIYIGSSVEPTFMVKAQQTSVTLPVGGSTNIDASILPAGGAFNNVVTMSATGLPPGATASFNPLTVIPGNAGAPTVLTSQLAAVAARIDPQRKTPFGSLAIAMGLCGMGFRRKGLSRRFKRGLTLTSLACVAFTLTGCGGGGFLRTSSPQPQSYVLTITGTSGSIQASTTVTVVVQ
ncbi:MAG: Ig-like domain repeat protein [Candidatus Sulfotelmatobacter sp.]